MTSHFDYMTAPPVEPRDGEEQAIYASGYQRSKAPSWHLLYEPFLAAMVANMTKGESLDGPRNPPNYLKATPAEDAITLDHLRQHLSQAIQGHDVEVNLIAVACNAMIAYHCIQHRKAQCE